MEQGPFALSAHNDHDYAIIERSDKDLSSIQVTVEAFRFNEFESGEVSETPELEFQQLTNGFKAYIHITNNLSINAYISGQYRGFFVGLRLWKHGVRIKYNRTVA